jgi:hypothetical protein
MTALEDCAHLLVEALENFDDFGDLSDDDFAQALGETIGYFYSRNGNRDFFDKFCVKIARHATSEASKGVKSDVNAAYAAMARGMVPPPPQAGVCPPPPKAEDSLKVALESFIKSAAVAHRASPIELRKFKSDDGVITGQIIGEFSDSKSKDETLRRLKEFRALDVDLRSFAGLYGLATLRLGNAKYGVAPFAKEYKGPDQEKRLAYLRAEADGSVRGFTIQIEGTRQGCLTPDQRELAMRGPSLGLPPRGTIFTIKGDTFIVDGLKKTRVTLIRQADGKSGFGYTIDGLIKILDRAELERRKAA